MTKGYPQKLAQTRDGRFVQVSDLRIHFELFGKDSMGQDTWTHHTCVEVSADDPFERALFQVLVDRCSPKKTSS